MVTNQHYRTIAAALGLSLLFAGQDAAYSATDGQAVYDKGDLGVYVRDGRFMRRVPEFSQSGTRDGTVSGHVWTDGQFRIDRGERGTWVRHGRFLWREPQPDLSAGASQPTGLLMREAEQYRFVDHYKHVHRFPK